MIGINWVNFLLSGSFIWLNSIIITFLMSNIFIMITFSNFEDPTYDTKRAKTFKDKFLENKNKLNFLITMNVIANCIYFVIAIFIKEKIIFFYKSDMFENNIDQDQQSTERIRRNQIAPRTQIVPLEHSSDQNSHASSTPISDNSYNFVKKKNKEGNVFVMFGLNDIRKMKELDNSVISKSVNSKVAELKKINNISIKRSSIFSKSKFDDLSRVFRNKRRSFQIAKENKETGGLSIADNFYVKNIYKESALRNCISPDAILNQKPMWSINESNIGNSVEDEERKIKINRSLSQLSVPSFTPLAKQDQKINFEKELIEKSRKGEEKRELTISEDKQATKDEKRYEKLISFLDKEYEKKKEKEDPLCMICLTNNVDSVFRPCGHGSCCFECSKKLVSQNAICHYCREVILFLK